MRSIAVARCVSRSLPFVFHHLLASLGTRFVFILFYVQTQTGVPVSSSPLSLLLLLRMLFVIQQCHRCSSCARHNAPTAEAGSILCACGRCALHSQYYSSNVCCCHRHWSMHIPAAVCVTGMFCSLPIPGSWIVYIRRVQYNQSTVRASCTATFVQKYLPGTLDTDCCVSYTADQ